MGFLGEIHSHKEHYDNLSHNHEEWQCHATQKWDSKRKWTHMNRISSRIPFEWDLFIERDSEDEVFELHWVGLLKEQAGIMNCKKTYLKFTIDFITNWVILLSWSLLWGRQWFQLHSARWNWLATEIHIDLYVAAEKNYTKNLKLTLRLHTILFTHLNTVVRVTKFKYVCERNISISMHPINRASGCYVYRLNTKKNIFKSGWTQKFKRIQLT